MSELTQFLRERISADEEVARAALEDPRSFWHDDSEYIIPSAASVAHVDRWDPVRALAECELKRGILEVAEQRHEWDAIDSETSEAGWELLTWLALPYRLHPAYRDEWRPGQR